MAFITRDIEYLEREIFVYYSRYATSIDLECLQWFTIEMSGKHLVKRLKINNHLRSMDGDVLFEAEFIGRDWLEVFSEAFKLMAKAKD